MAYGAVAALAVGPFFLRVLWIRVVAYDDPASFDPQDGLPGDDRVGLLVAYAEVFEQRAASDAKTGDPQVGRRKLAAEVVAAAERAPRFGLDLAAQER